MYTYQRTKTDSKSLGRYAALLSEVFTKTNKFTPEFLEWQYKDNPNGHVIGIDVFLEDELAGHYVCIPVKYSFYGIEKKGLLSLNTAIGINHRGKGLFTKLAKRTYDLAQEEGYDFVIGVANQNSTHGFLKKLDFELIGPLDVCIGLGQVQLSKSSEIHSKWDDESLLWRMNNPSNPLEQRRHFVFAKTGLPFVNVQMFNTENVSPKLKRLGLTVWMGKSMDKKQKGLFINLPDRLKPSPLNLIFKPLNDKLKYTSEAISFECIDFDAY